MPIFLSFFGSIRSIGGDGALLDGDRALSRWRQSSLSVGTKLKRWLSSNRKVEMESRRLVLVVFCHGANRRERVEQVLYL
ncbi:unnamed protein product [Brassica oleracea]